MYQRKTTIFDQYTAIHSILEKKKKDNFVCAHTIMQTNEERSLSSTTNPERDTPWYRKKLTLTFAETDLFH